MDVKSLMEWLEEFEISQGRACCRAAISRVTGMIEREFLTNKQYVLSVYPGAVCVHTTHCCLVHPYGSETEEPIGVGSDEGLAWNDAAERIRSNGVKEDDSEKMSDKDFVLRTWPGAMVLGNGDTGYVIKSNIGGFNNNIGIGITIDDAWSDAANVIRETMKSHVDRPPSMDISEMVDHPRHYNTHPSGVEAIDIMEHMDANISYAIGYLWRLGQKGDVIEDINKAILFLKREIERRQRTYPEGRRPIFIAGHKCGESK